MDKARLISQAVCLSVGIFAGYLLSSGPDTQPDSTLTAQTCPSTPAWSTAGASPFANTPGAGQAHAAPLNQGNSPTGNALAERLSQTPLNSEQYRAFLSQFSEQDLHSPRLQMELRNSPQAFEALTALYQASEKNSSRRAAYEMLLNNAEPRQLQTFAQQQLRSPDAEARKSAYQLLENLASNSDSPASVRPALVGALQTENDPAALAKLVSTVSSLQSDKHPMSATESDQVKQRIRQLASSEDTDLVRSSLNALRNLNDQAGSVALARNQLQQGGKSQQEAAAVFLSNQANEDPNAKALLAQYLSSPQTDPSIVAAVKSQQYSCEN
jgi:chemotaxis protein histidine kinase CheA